MKPRERMIAVVATAVLGLAALDQLLVEPLLARLKEANDRLDVAVPTLAANRETIKLGASNDRAAKAKAGTSLQSVPSAAESQVLNRVREFAQTAGLSLTSLKPERVDQEKGFQRITFRATATGTMSQVARFLFAVQGGDIPLRVGDLAVTTRREATDDLTLTIGLTTIFLADEANPPGGPSRPRGAGAAGNVNAEATR
jgi:type II secretory pathway component PulM